MARPFDNDNDNDKQRMVMRKGEATAKGHHAYQRPLQLAETCRCPKQRPGPARRALHPRDLQRRSLPLRSVRAACGRAGVAISDDVLLSIGALRWGQSDLHSLVRNGDQR